MIKFIIAVMAGVLTAMIVISAVEYVSHMTFPVPAGTNPTQPLDAMNLPVAALSLVVAGWTLGALIGGLVGSLMYPRGSRWTVSIVTLLLLAGIAVNGTSVPHPVWMLTAGALGVVASGAVVWWFAGRRVKAVS